MVAEEEEEEEVVVVVEEEEEGATAAVVVVPLKSFERQQRQLAAATIIRNCHESPVLRKGFLTRPPGVNSKSTTRESQSWPLENQRARWLMTNFLEGKPSKSWRTHRTSMKMTNMMSRKGMSVSSLPPNKKMRNWRLFPMAWSMTPMKTTTMMMMLIGKRFLEVLNFMPILMLSPSSFGRSITLV
jgi:hypothetical protein